MKVYITRDRTTTGILFPHVDIWSARPYAEKYEGGIHWFGNSFFSLEERISAMTIAECRDFFGTCPDSATQVISAVVPDGVFEKRARGGKR